MQLDALTAIQNFAGSIFGAGMDFLFVWGRLLGVLGLVVLFIRTRREGPAPMSPSRFITGLLTCAAMVSLPSFINAGGAQFGFADTTYDALAYVQPDTFGAAAGAANAVLSLARLAGVGFVLSGLSQWKKSQLDGNTGLSASETIGRGNVKFIAGVLLVFIDRVLDATLASLGLVF